MKFKCLLFLMPMALLCGCGDDAPKDPEEPTTPDTPTVEAPVYTVDIDLAVKAYDGARATDAEQVPANADADLYWQANTFDNTVDVHFDGNQATVTTSNTKIRSHIDGAYVAIDFLTYSLKNVAINVSGTTADGGLKIYGANRFLLNLNGVSITSKRGPAINNQCKKRMFVNLAENSDNTLEDATAYQDDHYYISSSAVEDRKGCLFSEANIILSGNGARLTVKGNNRHSVCTDGFFYMHPSVTLVMPTAKKNGLHVKGDVDDGIGCAIMGGYVYATVSEPGAKAIKCDLGIAAQNATMVLNTTGSAYYDSDEADTSSAACLKADTDVALTNVVATLTSTGDGGKCINAVNNIAISGGQVTATTSGKTYVYGQSSSAPTAIKSDNSIAVTGAQVYAYAAASHAINTGTFTMGGTTPRVVAVAGSDGYGVKTSDAKQFDVAAGTLFAVGARAIEPTASTRPVFTFTQQQATKGTCYKLAKATTAGDAYFIAPMDYATMCVSLSLPNMAANKADITMTAGATLPTGHAEPYFSIFIP